MSVASCYAYVAIEAGNFKCVRGAGPDYDSVGVVADNFLALLRKLAANDPDFDWFICANS
jgi:hypothetical protein